MSGNEWTRSCRPASCPVSETLISRRQDDIEAVRYATAEPLDENLIDTGSWPPDYDLGRATDIAQRGLDELAAVPLP